MHWTNLRVEYLEAFQILLRAMQIFKIMENNFDIKGGIAYDPKSRDDDYSNKSNQVSLV